jgi:hypothetical protein
VGDLGKAGLVEQRHLQRAVTGGQLGDGGGSRIVSIRAEVIIPRSPTMTSSDRPNRCRMSVATPAKAARSSRFSVPTRKTAPRTPFTLGTSV